MSDGIAGAERAEIIRRRLDKAIGEFEIKRAAAWADEESAPPRYTASPPPNELISRAEALAILEAERHARMPVPIGDDDALLAALVDIKSLPARGVAAPTCPSCGEPISCPCGVGIGT